MSPDRTGPDRLGRDFYARPTLKVARDLLGRRLVRQRRGRRLSGRIVEVEAYVGGADTACHARSGPTRRNQYLFSRPGRAYVYFTYGMHHLLNLVTEQEGFPAAVLLRALQPEEGQDVMTRLRKAGQKPKTTRPAAWLTGGPARLCNALQVDLRLNGEDLVQGDRLFLEAGEPVPPSRIRRTPRVGIDYAEEKDRKAPWRFLLRDNPFVSRGPAAS